MKGIAAFACLISACAVEDRSETSQPDSTGILSASVLDAAMIAELQRRYPRLGPEPLPEPRPSPDATPKDPPRRALETMTGEATFYARKFEGRRTASGIPFRHNQMVAAHRAYPFGTVLRVTNLRNDRSVNVRVVDRGPFGNSAKAVRTVIDLSQRAAEQLGYIQSGRTTVRIEVLEWGRGIAS